MSEPPDHADVDAVPMPAFGAGRFEVRGTLGAGRTGVVYRAFDHHARREVALKLVRHAAGRDPYRDKREFRAVAELAHPALVALHELFVDGDDWFFTMELVAGVSLIEHVRPAGVLDPVRLRAAIGAVVEGVRALHGAGVHHGDLGPASVRVTADGRVVVLGIALGEPGGSEDADWHRFGALLYEALTGAPPGEGPVSIALSSRALAAEPQLDELAALAIALLAPNPRARPTGAAIVGRVGAVLEPTARDPMRTLLPSLFVGRERELGELRAALADAPAAGVTVIVSGRAGLGKTALIRRFCREAASRATVLAGGCTERSALPFKLIDGVVAGLGAAVGELAPRELAAVVRMFPALRGTTAPIEIPATVDPHELRRHGFAGLRALLVALARDRPVVVAIDDVHWGDVDSAVWLGELVAQPVPNVVVVLAHRPEDYLGIAARVREAAGPAGVRALALGPLSADEAVALVAQLGLDPERAAPLVASAGGHPLVLAEIARTAARPSVDPADPVPHTIAALVAQRVMRLSPDARALLAVSAIAARPLSLALAAYAGAVVGGDDEAAALAAERLATVRRAGGQVTLDPAHDTIRAAVLAALDVEARAGWHEALARACEELGGEGTHDGLAEHWLAAGHPAPAATHAVPAAERAEAALAFHRAAELYGLALQCGTWERADERELRCRQAYALACAGELAAAAAAYGHAADLIADDDALDLERLRVESLLRAGRLADALPAAEGVLARIGVGRSLTKLAAQWVQAKLRGGLAFTERAVADVPPGELRKIDTLYAIASGLAFVDPALARVVQAELTRVALAAGEPLRVCLALAHEAGVTAAAGPRAWPAVEAILARLAPLARKTGRVQIVGIADVAAGLAAFLTGQWRRAHDDLARGLVILREHGAGVRWELDIGETYALAAMFYLGDWRALTTTTERLLDQAIERGDIAAQNALRTGRSAFAWLLRDRPDHARAELAVAERGLGDGFRLPQVHALIASVHIELYAGEPAVAAQQLARAWPKLERASVLRVHQLRAELIWLRARVALADRGASLDARLQLARAAADELTADGAPWTTAAATLVRASVAAFAGDAPAAADALFRAADQLAAADMLGWAELARLRLGGVAGALARDQLADRGATNPEAVARVLLPWPDLV